ncbi:hypothetical protein BJ170DRAFT_299891 [Xylariales sp. AK1849]|nr:hypothetical protein BJ170DRAFT_299891 [Xylariales sp. AK1849]
MEKSSRLIAGQSCETSRGPWIGASGNSQSMVALDVIWGLFLIRLSCHASCHPTSSEFWASPCQASYVTGGNKSRTASHRALTPAIWSPSAFAYHTIVQLCTGTLKVPMAPGSSLLGWRCEYFKIMTSHAAFKVSRHRIFPACGPCTSFMLDFLESCRLGDVPQAGVPSSWTRSDPWGRKRRFVSSLIASVMHIRMSDDLRANSHFGRCHATQYGL